MIWVGTNNSSEEEDDDYEEETYENELGDTFKRMDSLTNSQQLWKPGIKLCFLKLKGFLHHQRQCKDSVIYMCGYRNLPLGRKKGGY